jgi:hypothetical protein
MVLYGQLLGEVPLDRRVLEGYCSPRAELATALNSARCGSRCAPTSMGEIDIELY